MPWRLELLHTPLALAGGLMGAFGPIVQIAVLPMFHTRQHFPLRRTIDAELIGDDHARHVGQLLEEFPEELLGRNLVTTTLDQDIEDMAVLIHRPPQIMPLMPLTMNGEKYLIHMPCVACPRAPAVELMGILVAELPAPVADRLIRHDDPVGEQEFFHVPVAGAEAEIPPHRMADELGWEAVILRTVGQWCTPAASMAHQAGVGQTAQQVDNAHIGGPERVGSEGASLGPQHHGRLTRQAPVLYALQRCRATATVAWVLSGPQDRPCPVPRRGQQRFRRRIHR
jgi:hypothetical protein